MAAAPAVEVEVKGRAVRVSNPGKVFFPAAGVTKLGLVEYFLAVGDLAVQGVLHRPTYLLRHVDGLLGDGFYQKRVPAKRPEWLETVVVSFPSGRSAEALCPADLAHIVWAANLGALALHPWPVRRDDIDHPDELRIDLDPQPGVDFAAAVRVAGCVRDVLGELGYTGYPKTSGSRGLHVYVRIRPEFGFRQVRAAALALGREVERRLPHLATTAWWKEERGERVFIDYNQNARDRTIASAYSVRPTAYAQVSCPLSWDELPDVAPSDFTIATVPKRVARLGDVHAGIEAEQFPLEPLLEWVERDAAAGLGEAPYPPHHPKAPGEPQRVAPSRARRDP